jgi:hypothetical protein
MHVIRLRVPPEVKANGCEYFLEGQYHTGELMDAFTKSIELARTACPTRKGLADVRGHTQ